MPNKNKQIVTRFAPSPTGYLHIGGLRTALFNYLHARKNSGKFLLRIEDTDLSRNSKDAANAIIKSFEWVGLEHDKSEEANAQNNGIVYQSERFEIYAKYAKKLIDEGKAYYCYMSKEELESLREEQRARGETPKYDNRYRDFSGTPPKDIKPVIRIKAPLSGEISFIDGIKGKITINAKELDDFIIMRSDGSPTYNFVVALDDALMGVTDVIRGDDHTSNTPKQIIVYNALGFSLPKFFHIPMILNPEGKKLSKRDGAMGVMDYKLMGYLPEAILNFLVRLGFSYEDKEIFSLNEMKECFSTDALGSSPSRYNQEKFLWLNQHYIKQCDNKRLEGLLSEFGIAKIEDKTKRDMLYTLLKDRSKTLIEFSAQCREIFTPPSGEGGNGYDEKMIKKLDSLALRALGELTEKAEFYEAFESVEKMEAFLHTFVESFVAKNSAGENSANENASNKKALNTNGLGKNISKDGGLKENVSKEGVSQDSGGLKIGKFMPALRLALLGKGGGIGLCEALIILESKEAKKRIKDFLKTMNG
ncbi:glutamate--tRNA ligase [Helicobacter sp. T3_23-1059]